MQSSSWGKWRVTWLGLVMAGLWCGFGCSSGTDPQGSDDGTGGVGTGGKGTGGRSTGGDGSGGKGSGGNGGIGGIGGDACTGPQATGGAIYLYNCDEWLDGADGDPFGTPLDFSCGQGGVGGEGGAPSEEPALERVCKNASSPDFNRSHPVYHCLKKLTEDVCSLTHHDDVVECLTQAAPPCTNVEGSDCEAIIDACPGISAGTCFWAMTSARNPDYITECFAAATKGEDCEARFMRCGWGL